MNVLSFPPMKKAIALPLFLIVFFLFITRSASRASTLDKNATKSLSDSYSKLPPSHVGKSFNLFTSTAGIKARYLKQQKYIFSSNITIFIDGLIPYIPLSFGTPPQTLHFRLDIGGSITWFECGNYSRDPKKFPVFNPNLSSSFKYLTCIDPKHKLFAGEKIQRCHNCKANNSKSCLEPIDYEIDYGLGSTYGTYVLEVLTISDQTMSNFVVGCSSFSTVQASGIAGFGRGIESLPSQIGIRKFAYCLPTAQNKPQKGYLILNEHFHKSKLSYTPILNSLHKQKLWRYYIILEDIIIGSKSIRIPSKYTMPSYDSYGGTILDSSSSLTYMENSLFEIVRQEFQTQLGNHTFVGYAKHKVPCFNIAGKETNSVPRLAFQFKGGATMNLSMHNYLVKWTESDILCLPIISQPKPGSQWPAIILGNILLRDFYLEFDLVRNRFGFHAGKC